MRIGIDLGGTKIEGLALLKDGRETDRVRLPTPKGDYEGTIKAVQQIVEKLEASTGETGTVGIGIPGAVSLATGFIKNANSTCLIGKPFNTDLEAALNRPIRLANDADCFALSEATDGAAEGAPTVFGVILGTGVGGGIVINGRLISGPNAIAGEWGHNPLPWILPDEMPGPDCYCGKKGCIESWNSGPSFERDFKEHEKESWSAADIMEAARNGHRPAKTAFRRYSDRLARALSHVINLIDPHVIVLGGGMSNIPEIYDDVPSRWGTYVFSDRVDTKLVRNKHGDSSGVRGAAWLWPDH
jgi:fructokinase